MSVDELPEVEERAAKLALDALRAAMATDWSRATALTQQVGDESGAVGVGRALMCWADTLAYWAGAVPGQSVAIGFVALEDGRIRDADSVARPEIVWAGRLIAARAADDEAMWTALVDALPSDPQVIGKHVGAVLEIAALGCNRIRGRR